MFKLKFLGRFREFGFLVIRIGLGLSFVLHGSGKMFNPDVWPQIGGAMANWGVNFAPAFWGFMASFAEFGGGILMLLGFMFRPAMAMMAFTMAVATSMHMAKGENFQAYSHALEAGIVFLGLLFIGPGKLSLDGE